MIRVKKTPGISWMLPLSTSELQRAVRDICESIGLDEASLELNLVDDAEIAELNETFLGCSGPTNILSFPSGEVRPLLPASQADASHSVDTPHDITRSDTSTEPSKQHIGWLALSLETTVRESFLYQQDVTEHAIRLLAHGVLHLVGYDHGEEMFTLTDKAAENALSTLSAA